LSLADSLMAWYGRNRRDLPWRRTGDPYAVWVSEVMLQQTRVNTVIPYYERFLRQFPTVAALAAAPWDDVLLAWRGLGYYGRAHRLHEAAQVLVAEHGGVFPQDPAAARRLPGVGAYTAAAVCAIAYGAPVVAADGNVVRVMFRLRGVEDDAATPAALRRAEALARDLLPPDAARDYTQALMELGALICTPAAPHCEICPWAEACVAHRDGTQQLLPHKTAPKPQRAVQRTVALARQNGAVLLCRRPKKGLLADMWEFPGVDGLADAQTAFGQAYLPLRLGNKLLEAEHVFTHLRWQMHVHSAEFTGAELPPHCRWVPVTELPSYAIPTAFRSLGELLNAELGAL